MKNRASRFNRYFDLIFSPAAALMMHLNFTRKSVLLAVIALLAFSVITSNLYIRLNKVIGIYKQELTGLGLLPSLFLNIQLFQQHRGLSAGFLGGAHGFKEQLLLKQEQITDSFKFLEEKLPTRITNRTAWQEINSEWKLILDRGMELPVTESFFRHSFIIEQLLILSQAIADEYALINPPDLDIYYLLNTALHQLASTQEYLGQTRAFGIGILAQGRASESKRMQVHALITQADAAVKILKNNLDKTGHSNPPIQQELASSYQNIIASSQQIFDLVETDIIHGIYNTSPEDFFNVTTTAINTTYETLFQVLLPTTETLIKKHLAEAKYTLYLSLVIALLMVLLLLYFSIGIYIATIKTINSISRATLALDIDIFKKHLPPGSKSELKYLGNNFDLMADKLTQLVNKTKEDRSRIHAIVDSAIDALIQINSEGDIIGWSHQAELIFGWTHDEAMGQALHEIVIPKRYREAHIQGLNQFQASGKSTILNKMIETEALHRNGHEILIELTVSPIQIKNGYEFNAFIRDITERKQAEEKLQLLARVYSDSHQGISITDPHGIIIDVNPTFCKITGYSREDVIGKNSRILRSEKHGTEFYKDMWNEISQQDHWKGEIWNKKKNGNIYPEYLTISSIKDSENKILHYVAIFSDITESKQQQKALEFMAHYDALTQLPNRVLFADRFTQAIAHSKRSNNLLAVCFLDLDSFKPINDLYGHKMGDQLLIEVAQRIKATIREEDTVSRQGGDEFTLLLRDIDSTTHCKQLLERIHHSLAQPYLIDGHTHNISASSGVTLYPLNHADQDTLLRHADQAMYQAKQEGRNNFRLFDVTEDYHTSQKHHRLHEIKEALLRNEYCLYYQPKVNMKTGDIFGAEALIRWQHPEKGLIPPLQFLPIIEGTDVEIQLGNWVIDNSLKQLSLWNEQGLQIEVSINISSYHLQSSFYAQLDNALKKHPSIAPQCLQLEIVESSALGDLSSINKTLKNCRDTLGVNIALDDFGTGYSSLTHLKNLPAGTIKIDRSFVRDMLDDPNDHAIIDGVIGLANSFNREVIAEGVETHEQGLALLIMGCEKAQGYGIARPMPATEIPGWLNKYTPNQEWINYKP